MKTRHFGRSFFFLLLVAAVAVAQAELPTITVGSTPLVVEVADTPAKRQAGLMGRSRLAADRGMLFVFEKEKKEAGAATQGVKVTQGSWPLMFLGD